MSEGDDETGGKGGEITHVVLKCHLDSRCNTGGKLAPAGFDSCATLGRVIRYPGLHAVQIHMGADNDLCKIDVNQYAAVLTDSDCKTSTK